MIVKRFSKIIMALLFLSFFPDVNAGDFGGGFAGGMTGSILGGVITSGASKGSGDSGALRAVQRLEDAVRYDLQNLKDEIDELKDEIRSLKRKFNDLEGKANISEERSIWEHRKARPARRSYSRRWEEEERGRMGTRKRMRTHDPEMMMSQEEMMPVEDKKKTEIFDSIE